MIDRNAMPPAGDAASSPAAIFDQGRQAEEAGDLEQAYTCYRRALAARDGHADWHYRLGCVCLKSARFDEARICFENGLRQRPGDARMLTNLGAALDRLGRREEALVVYQRAAFLDGAPAEAFHNLGALYAEAGRTEEAIRAFSEAVQKTPDAEGYCSLGMVLMASGDLIRALDSFERCIACDRGHTRGHYYAAACLLKRGRYEEALARFDLVLGQEPGLVRAHFHRGVCLHKLERFKAALAALSQAEAAFPEDGKIHFQLALTCDALGLSAEARRHYHLARLLRDEDPGGGSTLK
jgi:tetratricopeptide (TPR) repeat protein